MTTRKEWSIINTMAATLAKHEGLTGAELSQLVGNTGAYRRLSEMRRLGLARINGKKVCSVSNKKAARWFLDNKPPEVDRGQETYPQQIKRLTERIKFLESENQTLVNEIDKLKHK